MKGWMYILKCSDDSYYTGSTNNLERRLMQHQNGEGAKHTKNRLPVKLVYFEEFQRIDEAFYREKQVQGWSRKKKEALIAAQYCKLPELSVAYRDIEGVVSRTSTTELLPEALEGSASTTELLPEALEGSTSITQSLPSRTSGSEVKALEGSAD